MSSSANLDYSIQETTQQNLVYNLFVAITCGYTALYSSTGLTYMNILQYRQPLSLLQPHFTSSLQAAEDSGSGTTLASKTNSMSDRTLVVRMLLVVAGRW